MSEEEINECVEESGDEWVPDTVDTEPCNGEDEQSKDNNHMHTNILYSFFVVKVFTASAYTFCLHAHTFLFWCYYVRRAHARYKKNVTRTYNALSLVHIT